MMENRELMTVGQVSAYLQIPVSTLYRWRSRGGGPTGFRLGRHLRYRPEDIHEWLLARRPEQ